MAAHSKRYSNRVNEVSLSDLWQSSDVPPVVVRPKLTNGTPIQEEFESMNGTSVQEPPKIPRSAVKYFPKNAPWRQDRPLKAIFVGAGIGGIAASVLVSKKVKNLSIAVYERYNKVGGTWAQNTYPGVRCDVPSHAYQLNFAPNTDWSEYYPKGEEIQKYYERVIRDYGIENDVHLEHEVLKATWHSEMSQWEVQIRDLKTQATFVETAHFFISSPGRITNPNYPHIPGLHSFRGDVVHTARWNPDFKYEGKRVAIIGNGASGQQLLPNIVKQVAQIDHYVRTKTWVMPTIAGGDLLEVDESQPGGPKYSEEEKRLFREDPQAHLEHRRQFLLKFHPVPGRDILGSPENNAFKERSIEYMLKRLGGDVGWLARLLPDYAPGCKRPTPSPGYLEALQSEKVDYITEKMTRVDESGIYTANGYREVDAIITATGFRRSYASVFPVIGEDGLDLREKWAPGGKIGYPETYLGVMAPGYPNYFTVLQAQANARGSAVPVQAEITATYIAKCIRKIQREGYVSLTPHEDAAQDFNNIVNGFFDNRVTSDTCDSWSKQGKGATRVLLAWPGTFHHRVDVLRHPRWEDFRFQQSPAAKLNRYEYFGDGSTEREGPREETYLTNYLVEVGKIDPATIYET